MCGLSGCIIPKYEKNADDFIRSSFIAGSLRGMDSSGIGQVYTDTSTFDSFKLPLNGTYFVTDKVADTMIRGASKASTVTICHTRHATVGGINRNTAHPFECYLGDDQVLLGAHNGTLTNWKTKKGAKNYDVDSEWALNHILAEKFDAFEDFTGAYCFVWWDADNKENLNIARNKERPMHVVMLKSGGMAYASEAGMLYWLLERHDVEMDGPVMELEADYWYKFPTDNPANFSKVKLPEVKSTMTYSSGVTRTPYTHVSILDKVRAVFAKKEVKALTVVEQPALAGMRIPKSPMVSEDEYNNADDLGMLGKRVEFTPWSAFGEIFEGEAEVDDSLVTAEVRGSDIKNYTYNEVWHCNIIGVTDDGRDLGVILGPPLMKDIAKKVATAH